MSDLVPDYIRDLSPYQPGKPIEVVERELGITGAIKIASNENPLGPSPLALAAARAVIDSVHLYPDGGCYDLRMALAEVHGVTPDELCFGAGSNELIHLIVQAFCRPGHDEVLAHANAFISYRLAAVSRGVDFVCAPVTEDLACDVDAFIGLISPRTKVAFLANPNNPTGAYVPQPGFERILAAMPKNTLLVVDEAYHEYAVVAANDYPRSAGYRRDAACRVVTLRTFSKIYGLAGLRVGYGICDADIADYIDRVRRPFNINIPAQAAAKAALLDSAHVEKSSRLAREGIERLSSVAQGLGLRPYPSLCNFVLIDVGRPGGPVNDALAKLGVIVRPMAAWGLPNCLRISIGTPEETERACAALKQVLA